MKTLSAQEIEDLEKRFRANLINSASGFKSANLIGSRSKDGIDNLALFSSVFHLGAHPPLLGFVMRPLTVRRDTYSNIRELGHFTVNALPLSMSDSGHRTAAKYEASTSEFDVTSFTSELSPMGVPYVNESPLKMTCELIDDIEVKANGTRIIVGKVIELKCEEKFLGDDGFFDLSTAGVGAISNLDSYHRVEKGKRFAYPRPEEPIKTLS